MQLYRVERGGDGELLFIAPEPFLASVLRLHPDAVRRMKDETAARAGRGVCLLHQCPREITRTGFVRVSKEAGR